MDQKRKDFRVCPRHHLVAALQFFDDFTGRVICSRDLHVRAEELAEEPVSKPDGWYLFLDHEGEVLTVTVSGRFYSEKTVKIFCRKLDPLNPVVRIRLNPSRSYAIPSHATCLEGIAQPDEKISVWCSNDPRPLRLVCDYLCGGDSQGRQICLYDPSGSYLEGRSFALLGKGEEQAEIFTVNQCPEGKTGPCFLENPLQRDHKKAGTSIFPVFSTQTDPTGKFFMLLPGMATEKLCCQIRICKNDGAMREVTVELEAGKITRLNLDSGDAQRQGGWQ